MEIVERNAYVNSAIESGISNTAVIDSISGVIKKSEQVGFVPKQFNKMIKTIMEAKTTAPEEYDNSLSSSLIRNNMGKLVSALKEGIRKEEVTASLSKGAISGDQDNMNFLSNLVAHMKKKENILSMEKTGGQVSFQKVYSNN